jgi:hypothetical protein
MLQKPHFDQEASVQSRSQDPVLQPRISEALSHSLPPFLALVITARVRICTPPSQSLVHFDQPDHSETTQSTGHLN